MGDEGGEDDGRGPGEVDGEPGAVGVVGEEALSYDAVADEHEEEGAEEFGGVGFDGAAGVGHDCGAVGGDLEERNTEEGLVTM